MEFTLIKTEAQYNEYCDILFDLAKKKPTKAIEDRMETLELFIDHWEDKHSYSKNKKLDPIQLLKYLMENQKMKDKDLVELLGITKGAVSHILSYKRGLSKEVIRKLSERFKMNQDAFNREYELVSEVNRGHKDEKLMNTKKELTSKADKKTTTKRKVAA